MHKARSGAPCLLLVVPLGLLILSCGTNATSAPTLDPAADQTPPSSLAPSDSAASGGPTGASTATDELDPPGLIGVPAGALAVDEEAATVEGIVAGTDSSTPVELPAPAGALRTRLIEFATVYLSFDYRVQWNDHVERLQPLVSETLLEQLATPLPATLRQRFDEEQRIAQASLLELKTIDDGVYSLTMSLTITTSAGPSSDGADDAETGAGDGVRALVVVVDEDQRVSDVR